MLGGLCWYCHWGWPKPVADIYQEFKEIVGEDALHWGPAHVVWEDENFDDHSIDFCIGACGENHAAVRESLVRLRAVPEQDRCVVPIEYDGEAPERFPPADGIEIVKKECFR